MATQPQSDGPPPQPQNPLPAPRDVLTARGLGVLAAVLSVAAVLPVMLLADVALAGSSAEAAGAGGAAERFRQQPWLAGGLERLAGAEWARGNDSWVRGLLLAAAGGAGAALLCQYLQMRSAARAGADAADAARRTLLLENTPLGPQAFHAGFGDRLSALLGGAVPAWSRGVRAEAESFPREPLRGALFLLLAAALNPWLGLAAALGVGLAWLLAADVGRRSAAARAAGRAEADRRQERLRGLAARVRLVKGYVADAHYRSHFARTLATERTEGLRHEVGAAGARLGWTFVALVAALGLAGLSAWNVVTARHGVAAAAAVLGCAAGAAASLAAWLRARRLRRKGEEAAARIAAFVREVSEGAPPDGTVFLPAVARCVELDDVALKDSEGKVLLDGCTAEFPAGCRTALLATDPAEARAVLDLLARFVDPARGAVRFDAQDIRGGTLESLRAQCCVALDGEYLFPDTVANNIACGDPGFARERALAAAQAAHAHHFVDRLPHGYECAVGEGGFPLKPGEAFRIALARAILRDPPVVALEEPAAPLDPDTDAVLDDALQRFLPGRTAILLPRRLATLRMCDHLVVLDKGRVVAAGPPEELFAQHPVCRYLLLTRFRPAPA